jgi:hypothetical protein
LAGEEASGAGRRTYSVYAQLQGQGNGDRRRNIMQQNSDYPKPNQPDCQLSRVTLPIPVNAKDRLQPKNIFCISFRSTGMKFNTINLTLVFYDSCYTLLVFSCIYYLALVFLAYPKIKVDLSNHQSVCVSPTNNFQTAW